eukprot:4164393-Prymnesium_polylepis.2
MGSRDRRTRAGAMIPRMGCASRNTTISAIAALLGRCRALVRQHLAMSRRGRGSVLDDGRWVLRPPPVPRPSLGERRLGAPLPI